MAFLKACLNGTRQRSEHPAVPITAGDLGRDAAAAVRAGAQAIHVHPRDSSGRETLEAGACAAALLAIREAAPAVTVGLTTAAWTEPDLTRRLELLAAWTVVPDFVSVNFGDDGADQVCELMLSRGIGVEAGLAGAEDADRLLASPFATSCLRVLVEAEAADEPEALETARAIDARLDAAGLLVPRVHHGAGRATWSVMRYGLGLGHGVRAGLEDTLWLPDGSLAEGNEQLVRIAAEMVARASAEQA